MKAIELIAVAADQILQKKSEPQLYYLVSAGQPSLIQSEISRRQQLALGRVQRTLTLIERSANHHRRVEKALQHKAALQRLGIPTTGPGNNRPNRPQGSHALTIKPDQSDQAPH